MDRIKNEKFIILLATLACIGLSVESIVMGWEFWVPPLILAGAVSLWVMDLSGHVPVGIRKAYYLVYAMLALFYHGVHETSFFDVAVVFMLVMVAYSLLDSIYMMNLFLLEYVVVMVIQFVMAFRGETVSLGTLEISRVILHVIAVVLVYFTCIRSINDRAEAENTDKEKEERIKAYEADMEDFLSNISHELRTPVNVVNGMSDLL
ncbi:MAG: HAMP domain-containing histidine kinase, partial [Lachnospiraceae bacterium]|nr:HAMP domain-containing histidine kinase [Lachnospiraceae bacterium]